MQFIKTEIKDKIGIITLNNPAKKNALCDLLCEELSEILNIMREQKVFVIVIKAEKDVKVWSSGHDISELTDSDPLDKNSSMVKAFNDIMNYPGPVIAMIHGTVWGGATELAAICDIVTGDNTAAFTMTSVKTGLPYNADGIFHFINRVGFTSAKELFFTAAPFDAEKAYLRGLINYYIDTDNYNELENFTNDLAKEMCSYSQHAIKSLKEHFRIMRQNKLSDEENDFLNKTRAKAFESGDFKEGVSAFLQKRKPNFNS